MPRLPRVYVEGAIYFITCKAAHNEKLFCDEKDYIMYIELLKKHRKEFEFKLYAYVLLPQHLHLFIEPSPSVEISEIMRSLNTAYSKYFNSRYQRRGHLFRERFKACLVEKDLYLIDIISHVHRNPIRSHLSSAPNEYPYSSASLYTSVIGDYEEIEALKATADIDWQTLDVISRSHKIDFHKRLQRGGVLGSKEFIKRVRDKIEEAINTQTQEEPQLRSYKGIIAGSVFALSAGIVITLFLIKQPVSPSAISLAAPVVAPQSPISIKMKVFDDSQWRLEFTSTDALASSFTDIVYFSEGKFISTKFSKGGFTPTDYSVREFKDKIIWETVQVSRGAMASWRGEFRTDSMKGVLSLRSVDEIVQDFSFVGKDYIRYKGEVDERAQ
jgi:REP-associated tyrosine transposase